MCLGGYCLFVMSITQCGSEPPGPASLGPRTLQETLKTVWDSKLGLEIKKKFGAQNFVWKSKKVWGSKLGPVNLSLTFVPWGSCSFVRNIIPPRFEQLSMKITAPDTKKRHRIHNLGGQIIGCGQEPSPNGAWP